MNPGKLKYFQEYPILLGSNSYFTQVILKCHEDIHHCGSENTFNRVRHEYWVIKGCQTVSKCVICKFKERHCCTIDSKTTRLSNLSFNSKTHGLIKQVLYIQGIFIPQIKKHISPIFLLVQQQIIRILNWQQNHPRVCYLD